MRLFIALDIPEEIRERLSAYAQRLRAFAPGSRWSKPENLHLTLKFIGHVADDKVPQIKTALARVHAQPFQIDFQGSGFFPNARAPRVFWAGIGSSDFLARLAADIDNAVATIGIVREEKPFRPHLTLARAGAEKSAQQAFHRLPQKLVPDETPQFGTMTAQEFFLYQSQPMAGGSRYTKLARFPLALTT